VQEFMGARYQEGYTKGIHDLDGVKIFHALLTTHHALQLARFSPTARACAVVYWNRFCPAGRQERSGPPSSMASPSATSCFPAIPTQQNYIAALQDLVRAFLEQTGALSCRIAGSGRVFCSTNSSRARRFPSVKEADQLVAAFNRHLASKGSEKAFAAAAAGADRASRQRTGFGARLGTGVSDFW
jgi:hypothetical protein